MIGCLIDEWEQLCVVNCDFGMNCVVLHGFAKASSSRLSENTRNSPLLLREVSPRRAGSA